MNIALIGPPGAGKGTHADTITSTYGLVHLSTGMLFREHMTNQSALGLVARRYMSDGALVPDEIVDAMIEEWVRTSDPAVGILFDGFPRTSYQAHFLDDLFGTLGRTLDGILYFDVSDDVIVERLPDREICRTCHTPYHLVHNPPSTPMTCDACGGELYRREDDNPDIVRKRLRLSYPMMDQLLDHYQESNKVILIPGDATLPRVATSVSRALDGIRDHDAAFATASEIADLRRQRMPERARDRPEHAGLDLVLLGGPGSGKGTQAAYLSNELDVPHIATGDLFRENLQNKTELGRLAGGYLVRGELVPDDITDSMVQRRLEEPGTEGGFILDGFPRNLHQAEALADMMHDMGRHLSGVLYMRVSDKEIIRRLSGRLICRICQTPYHLDFKPPEQSGQCDVCGGELIQRDDDNEETVRARLKTFHRQTQPLIAFYRKQGLLAEVDGEGDVVAVSRRLRVATGADDA